MSKTKTLFTVALLVLLGSMGAAQAQTIARVTLLTGAETGSQGRRQSARLRGTCSWTSLANLEVLPVTPLPTPFRLLIPDNPGAAAASTGYVDG